ncbi:MAG: AAA family ATPase [Flavobacteriales bacterium]|nr:AAA family ATPase [Flavobacteriales bacterium]
MIGRENEKQILEDKFRSVKSEFVALYGRRRVGKTFLIRHVFENRFTFSLTGLSNATLLRQLENFNHTIKKQYPRLKLSPATKWTEAFDQIGVIIQKSRQKRKVIFIDELPWFDTAHSGFISALEHFWNDWATKRKDVLLIVCGSAASWMINKLIHHRGGLHNRVTQRIKVEPFTLKECKELMAMRSITLDNYQLVQLYMVLGGIPFYWDEIKRGQSAAQNINRICFAPNGLLLTEFANLYKSLFDKAERHESIVKTLAQKGKGLTRDEISKGSGLPSGGGLTRLLTELEESGFIRSYTPVGKKSRNTLYQLCDFFSLFHLRFIQGHKKFDSDHWVKLIDSSKYRAWSGFAFEQVCMSHIPQIKRALGISGIETESSSWRSSNASNGAQIDLLIDRRDGVVNVCEMKFSIGTFAIDKKYNVELLNKMAVFKSETATRKSVFLTMITTFGLQNNAYSGNVQNDLNMGDLFMSA